uniref:Heat shock protein 70 n=1 Tax=Panagrolaimus sp. ES5 TaxID=591445 RepID=A0AC34F971_9BILA
MFEEIKLKIKGEFGHLCISINRSYGNETRKLFVGLGVQYGFVNVEIINKPIAIYLNVMSQINYKPINGKVIWICWKSVFYDELYVWEINVQKAKFCGRWEIDATKTSRLVASLKNALKFYKTPDVLLYRNTELYKRIRFQAVGIDLGTSRCCVAVNRNGGIATIPLDNSGERLLPSYVSYSEENIVCGKVVVNRLRNYLKSTIFDSKRIIGRYFNDIEIDEYWCFSVNFENEKVLLEVNGFNGKKKKITAEEVAADLLKYMKNKAEEFQGEKIAKVVITVPAAFTDAQKTATIAAAKLAGWNEIELLPEPIAAAFAYFIDRPISNNSTVLLFDLGGGTLDVCIFKVENNQIQIISNIGDSKLGGRNFDTVLINYFRNLLNTKYGIYRLMLESQRIKEDLSSIKNSSSNLKENQINKVLHVGGGSRMPMIKELLKEMFPVSEHCCEEHPDEVVAIGAAYYEYTVFTK